MEVYNLKGDLKSSKDYCEEIEDEYRKKTHEMKQKLLEID